MGQRRRDKQIWVMGFENEVGAFVPSNGHGPDAYGARRTFGPFWALASGGRDGAFGMDRVSSMVGLGDPFPPGIHSTGWMTFQLQNKKPSRCRASSTVRGNRVCGKMAGLLTSATIFAQERR